MKIRTLLGFSCWLIEENRFITVTPETEVLKAKQLMIGKGKVKSLDDAVNLFNQMVDAGQVTSTGIVAPSYVQKVAPSVSSIRLYVQPTICLEMLHQALVITSFGSVVSEGRLIPMDVLLLYWKSGLTWVLISIYQLRSVTKGKTTTLALDSQLENRGGCLNRD
ncbi:uncharacterized protein LOC129901562 isoform X2 [Solanum dulcamara]|uniref:uncharacterized protein LOC129901562 isoform X2 n=1 Tax=Solanum dulcamara TaxID=45834 RepID=UPI002485D041|nr:uncharacterized protein LOC129901562 isoform X2 [Solanum dulcamara]